MKVGIIGSGGREHAICQSLKNSNKINKILTKYAADNAISLVVQKKNIIIGKSELDITDEILKEFNNQIKSID